MNLRENGIPVTASPQSESGDKLSTDPSLPNTVAAVATGTQRSPTFNLTRAVILAVAGVLTGSQALVAGACFFLATAISDFTAVLARRRSAESRDSSSWSSARMLLGSLVMSMAAGLTIHGITVLQAGIAFNRVNPIALLVALISLLVREEGLSAPTLLVRSVFAAAAETGLSVPATSAVTSFLVFVGVLGNVAGLTMFDPFAGVLVTALAFRSGWRLLLQAGSR